MTTCIFFFVCQVVEWGPQPCKIFDNNHTGCVLCFLQYPAQLSLTWSGEINLPSTGVSLYMKNLVDLNYYIRFAVLWLASVPDRCLVKYWGANISVMGTEDGPSVLSKLYSTLYFASALKLLKL